MEQVYIFDFGDKIKAGYSKNVKKRLRTIELSSGVKAKQVYSVDGNRKIEQLLHACLNGRLEGEFFACSFDKAKDILDKIKGGEIAFDSIKAPNHRYMYSALFTPTEDNTEFYACVPDLPGCVTTGDSLDDAIEQITDAASGWLVVAEDEGLSIPPPTPQNEISHDPSAVFSMIRVDTIAYRALTDTRAVRKNVSLPAWMSDLADKRGINCSQVLQEGLRARLEVG